jgi:hypothetical protein
MAAHTLDKISLHYVIMRHLLEHCYAPSTAQRMAAGIGFKGGRGVDALRDSRIASHDGFRNAPPARAASEVRSGCVSTKTASLAQTE